MQTRFTEAQLADPDTASSAGILRACVHCGFCTATCPTYVLLGDELDSPRGRIYLIKDMLENDRPATEKVVKHIDRCLSCLACMTTCPSGVNYMHLVDHARQHIERTYRRPWQDRAMRRMLEMVLPKPGRFRAMLLARRLGQPLIPLMPAKLRAMASMAPSRLPRASRMDRPRRHRAEGTRIRRVALMIGCAQRVLAPQINEATIRLLTRHGCEVVVSRGAGCCGALTHHLGRDAHDLARANILAWSEELEQRGLDAIVINASGCGTTVKDYGHMFRTDPELADKARTISALARDITEVIGEIGLQRPSIVTGQRVAYHSACSLQHGQRVQAEPRKLLAAAGFEVAEVPEGHLCCGSAGTYNLLQPEIAGQLRDRKVANIERTRPDVIAAGNIGCMTQIATGTGIPVLHTVELLDWATGGPRPPGLVANALQAAV
ncbi:glycolate oxidase subunit GlcF [Lichenicoccus roseus]|uniref:Glycolate oxidase iron-sulfur subunit n=1 Tax=Lichenicoccus roseus TaxID=2683649 RepID=A0A5R9JBN0_9PROT|nr:glycolate oxidase subunit GlcF [Lichenicoccus roseus]TLU73021.1 glycolate oxidase subunit GlcF [Lichenicoccus roseus]